MNTSRLFLVLSICFASCAWGEDYSNVEIIDNSETFIRTVLGPSAPSVAMQQTYAGMGNDKEWLTQLRNCLEHAGIVVAASRAFTHRESCKAELMSNSSVPSEYYRLVRALVPRDIGEPSKLVVDEESSSGRVRVTANYAWGSGGLFHALAKEQEDLGLISIDFVLIDDIRHEIEDQQGNVELLGW